MSQPSIPDITPQISLKREDSVNLILASIAMQEMGISHIINAEAEKLQYVMGTLHKKSLKPSSLAEIHRVNSSVRDTIKELMRLEMLLQAKLDTVKAFSGGSSHCDVAPTPDPDPASCTTPCPPPDPAPDPNPQHWSYPPMPPVPSPPSRSSHVRTDWRSEALGGGYAGYRRRRKRRRRCRKTGSLGRSACRRRTWKRRKRLRKRCFPCLPLPKKSCKAAGCRINRPLLNNVIIIKNNAKSQAVASNGQGASRRVIRFPKG